MDPLRVSALGSVALNALNPPLPPAPPTAQASAGRIEPPQVAQGLAQNLFQAALQTSVGSALGADSALGGLGFLQDPTASLLAALSAPSAPQTATPAADTPPTPTPNPVPAAIPAAAQDSTAPSPAPAALIPAETPTVQDTFLTGSSPDFALQTALRFGAGVAAQAAPEARAPDLAANPVRDPASVLRLGNLQPHAGGPGPEAFTHPQAAVQRALRSYQPPPPAPAGQVDLTA